MYDFFSDDNVMAGDGDDSINRIRMVSSFKMRYYSISFSDLFDVPRLNE